MLDNAQIRQFRLHLKLVLAVLNAYRAQHQPREFEDSPGG